MDSIQSSQQHKINFGMFYKNPKKWGEKTLQAFIDSDLRKAIDKKYPDAQAIYKVTKKKNQNIHNETAYFLNFTLKLNKRKTWEYYDSAFGWSNGLDYGLAEKLKKMKLENIEAEVLKKREAKKTHNRYIRFAQKENKNYFIRKLLTLFNVEP